MDISFFSLYRPIAPFYGSIATAQGSDKTAEGSDKTAEGSDKTAGGSDKTAQLLPKTDQPLKIALTSGASCPDAVVDRVLQKALSCFTDSKEIGIVIEGLQTV